MRELAHMETEMEGLHTFAPEALPFEPSLHIRAFLLRRAAGNLVIYSIDGLQQHAAAMADLGEISRQYLNHWHEAMFASDRIQSPLFVHDNDLASAAKRIHVDGTFSTRHALDEDFEVIPIPGHTRGATAYLWDNGGHRFFFTGDTVLVKEGEWVAAVLEPSDRESYIESLALIRELDFDVLVPWAATGGGPYYAVTNKTDARNRLTAILDRVGRGENH